MQISRQKGGRLKASVAASPRVLLCVGGGHWDFRGLRSCVSACVIVFARRRRQLPPKSPSHHQALPSPSLSPAPPPSSIPKVNLFTVILKGELFAVIVRTDEGQALRGGTACPWRVGPLSDAPLRN